MFLYNYHIIHFQKNTINSISSYTNIMNKFILKFISNKKNDYIDCKENLYLDAIVYSKYYLYWKIYGCVYQESIMNLLYDIEYIK